jgi:predicted acylesterase/phospholipase RssA
MPSRDLALTLAGGGNRAFYQLGLLTKWGADLFPRVRVISTCSAGACVATLILSGRKDQAYQFWRHRRDGITRNVSPRRLLHGQHPMPHARIYREALLHALIDGGLERVRAQPFPILVLTTALPKFLPRALSVPLGMLGYSLEKRLHPGRLHPTYGRRLGFAPAVFDARECETPGELADLVLASSATPPFTPVGRHRGQSLLDGGLIDNAPAFVADEVVGVKKNLVLLTRAVPSRDVGARLYVAPSVPVPVKAWDYTRPDLLDDTIAMGERESALHEPALRRFLS